MTSQRNIQLDLMRFLGVLTIMVAHAAPPDWLFQLRNFGTPLLIVASALTYAVVYSGRKIDPPAFCKKRLTRLIVPAWIFLTFFFLLFLAASKITNKAYPFSFNEILGSYTLYDGIGFVWILKVYCLLALLTPVSLKISAMPFSNTSYFLFLLMLYGAYEFALSALAPSIPKDVEGFFNTVIFVLIPYAILYLYGMRLGSLANKYIIFAAGVSLLVFLGLAFAKYVETGHFVQTQKFKYPPTIYYLSYAFFALNLVYLICRNLSDFGKRARSMIVWLASNSLWIYLWHIMAFYVLLYSVGDQAGGFPGFIGRTVFLLGFGMAMTYVQVLAVKKFVSADHYVGRKAIAVLT